MAENVLILGAGQAGTTVAVALRDGGFQGGITLVGEESRLPYVRPPLSKGLLSGELLPNALSIKPAEYYRSHRIDLLLGVTATGIDRASRRVSLGDGSHRDFDALVLATGARPRTLSCPGAHLAGVHALRTVEDGLRLRAVLRKGGRIAVIGGGFVGMELAAVARDLGCEVVVVEAAGRLMTRGASGLLAKVVLDLHRQRGVEVHLDATVQAIEGVAGQVAGLVLGDGRRLACDAVVASIGITPATDLAERAGLACDNGILVTEALRSVGDPAVFAIGDCARFPVPYASGPIRLESVQNALDQARHVARDIASGQARPFVASPWFWTEQFGIRMQMAGWTADADQMRTEGSVSGGSFSIEYHRKGRLVGADSINQVQQHMKYRKVLQALLDEGIREESRGHARLDTTNVEEVSR